MNKVIKPKVTFSDNILRIIETSNNHNVRREIRPRTRSIYTTRSYSTESLLNIGSGNGSSPRDSISKSDDTWCPSVPKPIIVKNFAPDDFTTLSLRDDGNLSNTGTIITPNGVISLRLHDRIRVDLSLNQAVRVVNMKNLIALSLDSTGSASALIHQNGRILQYGSRVEIYANDIHGNNKYAKMWYKGVSFTSDQCALVYLVDSAGTRTTTDTFTDLSGDISMDVFYNRLFPDIEFENSSSDTRLINEAINILQKSTYWLSENHTDNWIINNIRISQTADGLVRIGRNRSKYLLRTSPTNGSASITTPYIHCTASMGKQRHLFVRRGERRMHYDGKSFVVRNAGHSAGFDNTHQLTVL